MIRWLICLALAHLMTLTSAAFQESASIPDPRAPHTQASTSTHGSRSSSRSSDRSSDVTKPSTSTPININTATVEELDALPGVGLKMAQRIVDYRQKQGPFKRIEDLMNVQGIGEKNFLKLKPLITISTPKADRAGTM
jgi:competence protein ComEA